MSNVLSLESQIQGVNDTVWEKLDGYAREGKNIDMDHWASYIAIGVVGKLALGLPIGFPEIGIEVKGIIQSIHMSFY